MAFASITRKIQAEWATRERDFEAYNQQAAARTRAETIKRSVLLLICAISIGAATAFMHKHITNAAFSLPFFALGITFALFRRTPQGRGFIWAYGRGASPTGATFRVTFWALVILVFGLYFSKPLPPLAEPPIPVSTDPN